MKICPVINYLNNVSSSRMNSAITPVFGGKNLLAKPIVDKCCFSHTDKSLSPKLLKSLVEIDKKDIGALRKAEIIKDELLKAMGYKHPEALEIKFRPKGITSPMSYECTLGKIFITEGQYSSEYFIAALRHELEHVDQFVKITKLKEKRLF